MTEQNIGDANTVDSQVGEDQFIETTPTEETVTVPKAEFEAMSAEVEKHAQIAADQKKRAEKAERGNRVAPETTQAPDVSGELADLKLQVAGFTDGDQIDYIKREAEEAGKSVDWVMNNPGHKSILDQMAQEKVVAEATPEPSGRGNESANGTAFYADKLANGEITDEMRENPALIADATEELARRERLQRAG